MHYLLRVCVSTGMDPMESGVGFFTWGIVLTNRKFWFLKLRLWTLTLQLISLCWAQGVVVRWRQPVMKVPGMEWSYSEEFEAVRNWDLVWYLPSSLISKIHIKNATVCLWFIAARVTLSSFISTQGYLIQCDFIHHTKTRESDIVGYTCL